jgi:hypothetical protein
MGSGNWAGWQNHWGGKWDPYVKRRYIPMGKVQGTELENHIILDKEKKMGRK